MKVWFFFFWFHCYKDNCKKSETPLGSNSRLLPTQRVLLSAPSLLNTAQPTQDALSSYAGFAGGSDSKESACSAGGLGLKDPLGKGSATPSGVLGGNPMDRGTWWSTAHGVAESQARLSD